MKSWLSMIKKNYVSFLILGISMLLLTFATIYFSYSLIQLVGVMNVFRYLVIAVIIIIWFLFLSFSIKNIFKRKKTKFTIIIILKVIYIIILVFVGYFINHIYNKIDKIGGGHTTYSTSIIALKETSNSLSDVNGKTIGIINNANSTDGYKMPKEMIKENKLNVELEYFDGYSDLLKALEKEEVSYVFLPTNYKIMFNEIEELKEILDNTKIIKSYEKQIKMETTNRRSAINKPFSVLVMGVDSEKENIAGSSFNGDALILITFNPKTLTTTMLSIPRDTYVPISCFAGNRKNKITHAAWYGEECMKKTIENFMDIKIDYHVKINFKGVVKLVDALGGVEVDVPYTFCEQDSNRNWGKNTVYVEKGLQTLNGEQALALSRNRKNNSNICGSKWGGSVTNDFVRGQNQQLVIKGLLNKAKTIRSIDTLNKLLETISNNMQTNMTTPEILSFYNVGMDVLNKTKTTEDAINIQKLYLTGYDKTIVDYSQIHNQGTKGSLYNFVPYKGSISDISNAMKVNLGLKNKEIVKSFSFTIDEPYEEEIIGKGNYNEATIPLLLNFIGKNETDLISYANKNKITYDINYVESTNSSHSVGEIIKQTPYAGMDLTYVNKIVVDVVKKINVTKPTESINCALAENKDESSCKLPNFIGMTYESYLNWKTKNSKLSILFEATPVKLGDPKYNPEKQGKVIYQNYEEGTSLYNLIDKTIKIEYIEKTQEESNEETEENTEEN